MLKRALRLSHSTSAMRGRTQGMKVRKAEKALCTIQVKLSQSPSIICPAKKFFAGPPASGVLILQF